MQRMQCCCCNCSQFIPKEPWSLFREWLTVQGISLGLLHCSIRFTLKLDSRPEELLMQRYFVICDCKIEQPSLAHFFPIHQFTLECKPLSLIPLIAFTLLHVYPLCIWVWILSFSTSDLINEPLIRLLAFSSCATFPLIQSAPGLTNAKEEHHYYTCSITVDVQREREREREREHREKERT